MHWPPAIWSKKSGLNGRVADQAAGALCSPDPKRFRIDPEVSLVPIPQLRRPVFLGELFTIAFGFHAVVVDQHMQCSCAGRLSGGTVKVF